MKTATVADLRNHFPKVAAWVAEGHTIAITRRGQTVANLVPPTPAAKPAPFKMPDFRAQRKAIWGNRRPMTAAEVKAMDDFMNEGQQG
jgi:antitoxin (DNA-binding transcriptional repressor) of toxin-antitoxin stability system